MFSKTTYNNIDFAVITLVKFLKIPITKRTIVDELELHPNYPSLLAASDILSQFNIPSYSFKNVSIDNLSKIPYPFIVHTTDKGNEFAVIKNIENGNVHLNYQIISLYEFGEKFDGIILVPDPLENAGDINYNQNKRLQFLNSLRDSITIFGLLTILLLGVFFYSNYFTSLTLSIFLITLVKTIGLVTAILLLIQSIDANNPLIQKLCQSDTNFNCNAILSSKSAKIFNWLSWSEIGFFYFSGTLLSLLFNSTSTAVLQILSIINIISLPYTIYSIYYQARIAKQWCILCCTIQLILWFEFFPLIHSFTKPFIIITTKELSSLVIFFVLPIIIWIWIKPFLLNAQKVFPLNRQLNKFKFNIELFNKLLTEQPKYVTPETSWSIVLGSEKPDKIITMVTNSYCAPCGKAHEQLSELLSVKKNIQLRIVFVFNNVVTENDKRLLIAKKILSIDRTQPKTAVIKAMNEWYEQKQKNVEKWLKEHPSQDYETIDIDLDRQLEWCNLAEIIATPTILVDGYKLPYPYELSDLMHF